MQDENDDYILPHTLSADSPPLAAKHCLTRFVALSEMHAYD